MISYKSNEQSVNRAGAAFCNNDSLESVSEICDNIFLEKKGKGKTGIDVGAGLIIDR